MEEGILLTIVFVIFVIIAGIVLSVVSFSVITSFGTLNFGISCFTSFTQYKIVNTFLAPLTGVASFFGASNIVVNSVQSAQVQKNCLQSSNIDQNSYSGFATQFYTEASSCFSLFAGGNAAVGLDIISAKNMNRMFNCYDGLIINNNKNIDYYSIIKYIDSNYNGSYPLQIVFITNGSNGNAQYVSPNDKLLNGTYIISYLGYPSNSVNGCYVSFRDQCDYTSGYDQPIISNPAVCDYSNETTNQTFETVSSLSNGNPAQSPFGSCDYYVPICGKLSNYMVYGQNRVFICIQNGN